MLPRLTIALHALGVFVLYQGAGCWMHVAF